MKSAGVLLIVVSLLMVFLALVMIAAPQLFVGQSQARDEWSRMGEALGNTINLAYWMPVWLIGACFVQIFGWGLLITGLVIDVPDFITPLLPRRKPPSTEFRSKYE